MIAKDAFLAPLTLTFPFRALPPLITNLSKFTPYFD
jgi:hypothetical protein